MLVSIYAIDIHHIKQKNILTTGADCEQHANIIEISWNKDGALDKSQFLLL